MAVRFIRTAILFTLKFQVYDSISVKVFLEINSSTNLFTEVMVSDQKSVLLI